MTNEQIIMAAMALNGVEEESHTFARWKKMGYAVRKGEHAAFKATIWKAQPRKAKDDGGEEGKDLKMFMKTANFFTASQVEAIA